MGRSRGAVLVAALMMAVASSGSGSGEVVAGRGVVAPSADDLQVAAQGYVIHTPSTLVDAFARQAVTGSVEVLRQMAAVGVVQTGGAAMGGSFMEQPEPVNAAHFASFAPSTHRSPGAYAYGLRRTRAS
jgi:hypothetical protein